MTIVDLVLYRYQQANELPACAGQLIIVSQWKAIVRAFTGYDCLRREFVQHTHTTAVSVWTWEAPILRFFILDVPVLTFLRRAP